MSVKKPAARATQNAYFPSRFNAIPVEFYEQARQAKFCSDLQKSFIQLIAQYTWSITSLDRETLPLEWTAAAWTAAWIARELASDVDSVQWMLGNAVRRKLVARKKLQGQTGFAYRTHPDMWIAAEPHVPAKREPDDDDELEDDAEPVEPATPPRPVNAPLVVQPGRRASIAFSAEAVKKVTYCNEGPAPLDVEAAFADGVISLRFGVPKAAENGLNGFAVSSAKLRNGLRSFSSEPGQKLRNGLRSFSPRPALREHLQTIFNAAVLGPIRDELWAIFCNNLGAEPSDDFTHHFLLEKLAEKRRAGYKVTPGLYLDLARDARAAWEASNVTAPSGRLAALVAALEEYERTGSAADILVRATGDEYQTARAELERSRGSRELC